ncbi:NUDIX domain-containing protein, partial [Actinoplanes sp. NPDC026623]|uniref:NUDIX domain-containing protein n=1 Tax=Actinoplanes sp. NPDC026623 TaxID=3155610 RepID=UPI00340038B3
ARPRPGRAPRRRPRRPPPPGPAPPAPPAARPPPGGVRYAVFRRSDDDAWQSVSGGVEGTETLAEAARRETTEETGLTAGSPLYELDMVSGVEKSCFDAAANWPATLYIVSKHFFAMDVSAEAEALVLSAEHKEFRWLSYENA